ncbi:Transcriptional regulator sdnM, partial [Lachnellula suecica]
METLKQLTGAAPGRKQPAKVATDDIYPVHMLDDTKTLRGIVVAWTFRFNDVLDPEKLHGSLARLLEIGDWRKVGGRLRLKDDGQLEIHVPTPFTPSRPAITYTHQTLSTNIDDHPLAQRLPKATDGPSIQAGPPDFQVFAAADNAPATLDDFLYSDRPQLSLHITSFNDATLVALLWPHTLMDAMGQQALLKGWSLVLAGREAEVLPLLGARVDAMSASVGEEGEGYRMAGKALKGWRMLKFGLRFGWGVVWGAAPETRSIFLPGSTVANLRLQAQRDIEKDAFVSDNDILTAWATRAIASSVPQARPVTVLNVVNARLRLPSLLDAPGVFVQNMAVPAFTCLSADTVAARSLGTIALENRRQLMEQASRSQIVAFLQWLQGKPKAEQDPSFVCGETDAILIPVTNWERANFYQAIDFSAAVVKPGYVGERNNPPGSIVYHHASSMRVSAAVRNVLVVVGKDFGGGYWMTGIFSPATWAK